MATLYVGDSIFKYVVVDGTEVRSLSGAQTCDITSLVRDVSEFDTVVIHVGTNDLARRSVADTFEGFTNLLSVIRARAPMVRIFLSAILPRAYSLFPNAVNSASFLHGFNERARQLNRKLRELVDVTVIDHPMFGTDARHRYLLSRDGLHLSPDGIRKLTLDLRAATAAAQKKRRIQDETFLCEHEGCDKSYGRRGHLLRHERETHCDPEDLWRCFNSGCEQVFKNKENLQKHIKRKHTPDRYKCQVVGCGLAFRKHHQLKTHSNVHNQKLPFRCKHPDCEKAFPSLSKLLRHAKMHDGYVCKVEGCNAKFEKWVLVIEHRKLLHVTEYTCEVCEKTFRQKYRLKCHLMTHTTNRPVFTCEYDGCDRKYTENRNLQSHIRSYHKGQRWKCQHPDCDWDFITKQKMKQHMDSHHDQNKPPKKRKRREKKSPVVGLTGISLETESRGQDSDITLKSPPQHGDCIQLSDLDDNRSPVNEKELALPRLMGTFSRKLEGTSSGTDEGTSARRRCAVKTVPNPHDSDRWTSSGTDEGASKRRTSVRQARRRYGVKTVPNRYNSDNWTSSGTDEGASKRRTSVRQARSRCVVKTVQNPYDSNDWTGSGTDEGASERRTSVRQARRRCAVKTVTNPYDSNDWTSSGTDEGASERRTSVRQARRRCAVKTVTNPYDSNDWTSSGTDKGASERRTSLRQALKRRAAKTVLNPHDSHTQTSSRTEEGGGESQGKRKELDVDECETRDATSMDMLMLTLNLQKVKKAKSVPNRHNPDNQTSSGTDKCARQRQTRKRIAAKYVLNQFDPDNQARSRTDKCASVRRTRERIAAKSVPNQHNPDKKTRSGTDKCASERQTRKRIAAKSVLNQFDPDNQTSSGTDKCTSERRTSLRQARKQSAAKSVPNPYDSDNQTSSRTEEGGGESQGKRKKLDVDECETRDVTSMDIFMLTLNLQKVKKAKYVPNQHDPDNQTSSGTDKCTSERRTSVRQARKRSAAKSVPNPHDSHNQTSSRTGEGGRESRGKRKEIEVDECETRDVTSMEIYLTPEEAQVLFQGII